VTVTVVCPLYVPRWRGEGVDCIMKADHTNNHAYNKTLRPFAHKLRSEMTKAEASLWKYVLKARQIKGYQFRRQRPVLKYIADFMCIELRLVIEVDGITHGFEETAVKDDRKDTDLASVGIRVLRFTDDDVLKNIHGVAKRIEDVIEEIKVSTPAPPPAGDKAVESEGLLSEGHMSKMKVIFKKLIRTLRIMAAMMNT
jgi:very-short-patch-repair endonuclease